MKITFCPKPLLVAVAFLIMFGATLDLAVTVRNEVAVAGVLGILAYLLVEIGVVVNPAEWGRSWRNGNEGH